MSSDRRRAHVTVIGDDKGGVIARICSFLFDCGGNIEELDQHVTHGLFTMHLDVSWPATGHTQEDMKSGLDGLATELGMEILFNPSPGDKRRLAILVTREEHAPRAVLEALAAGDLDAEPVVMIGNKPDLQELGHEFGVPFYYVDDADKPAHEKRVLELLQQYDSDVVVLARYMRILSPNFVWRYPHRIVNIHPSLLPAFPGAVPYRQAVQRGVRVAGVTSHLVTMDLDQGPILEQASFRIEPSDTVKQVVAKGQKLESEVLLGGLKMILDDQVEVGWGRTWMRGDDPPATS
ncbi:MAG: formyltetrahydrofolate deformylase [Thermoplasmatota archaeon]